MIEEHKLSNGLKVFLIPNKKAPVITIQSWVRTGSADEEKGQEGLSHFIEHLLFKGTEKYKVGEIAQLIEGAGGELNAYTSFDQTVFYMTLSSQYTDLGLEAMGQMMGRPLFDSSEVDNEREVVIEEIKRSNDSPSRISSQNLFSTVFEDHPYKRPVIGYDTVIKKTPVEKIKKLYFQRYCPENMFLIVVGDFDKKIIKEKIKKNFLCLKGKLKQIKRPKEREQREAKINMLEAPFSDCFVNVAFKTLTKDIKEIAALDLLSYILSYGDTTRLVQALRIKEHLVNELGSYQFDSKDPGFFTITIYSKPDTALKALEKLSDEILFLFTDEVEQAEIQKAIVQIESSEYYQETMDALARKIGNDQFNYNDPQYFTKYIKILKQTSPSDISKVIKKYFKSKNLNISAVYPSQNQEIRSSINEWKGQLVDSLNDYSQIETVKSQSLKDKVSFSFKETDFEEKNIQEVILENGSRLILKKIPNTHVVSARFGFLGGLRSDPHGKAGLSELLSRNWLSGTKNKTEDQISEILESAASYIGPFSGRNSIGLHLQTLSAKEQETSDLLKEVLLESQFPNMQFEREKKVLLNYHKSLVDHPSSLVFLDFLKQMFAGHPYQTETIGTDTSVESLTDVDAKNLFEKLVVASNMTAVIAGNIDLKYWENWFLNLNKKMKTGQKMDKKFELDSITREISNFRALKKEQSHIICGFRGIKMTEESRHTLTVLQTILSGQGGRLFINLRDKASLAYSVSPVRMDGIESGYFGAYIGCSPEKGTKAIEMMMEEFEKLKNENVSEQELDRAKKNIIGKHDISLQKTANISQGILFDEIYGIKYLDPKDYAEKINSVTRESILKLAQKIFSQKTVKACVGPVCPWQ